MTNSLGIRYRAAPTVRYRLKPFGPGGRSAKRWCRGLYRGTVDFVREPAPAAARRALQLPRALVTGHPG